jgi:hypothetical protein
MEVARMQSTSVLSWFLDRRALALLVALVLVVTVAVGLVMGSSTTTAASADDPAPVEVVVDDDVTLAGPSWTWSRSVYLGPSWG